MEKIHFIAIGGSIMHNLAIALKKIGYHVTGSDDEIFEPSKSRLKEYGLLPVKFGWSPENISSDLDMIILGMHAKKDNPELLKAKKLGIKILSFPEFLALHAQNKKRVVIAGSHGKTTTTAMVMHVLKECNIKADFIVGAKIDSFDLMVELSEDSEVMIFEGDEYLTSPLDPRPKFIHYQPHIAVINGIAWDHINVFPTEENYFNQFKLLLEVIKPDGQLFWFSEDENVRNLISQNQQTFQSTPFSVHPFKVIDHIFYALDSTGKKYPLKIFGKHNMQNLKAAHLICTSIGVNNNEFYSAITSFNGAAGRLQLIGENQNTAVFKDFAHAPSKVSATVQAVKDAWPERRIIAVLELHTYSSLTKSFLTHYEGSLKYADQSYVYFNPHTINLKRLEPISEEDVSKGFNNKNLKVFTNSKSLFDKMATLSVNNCVILFMSSGNFDGINMNKLLNTILN